jgi:hypothetical protein
MGIKLEDLDEESQRLLSEYAKTRTLAVTPDEKP